MTIGYVWFGALLGAAFGAGIVAGCMGCAWWAASAMNEDLEG